MERRGETLGGGAKQTVFTHVFSLWKLVWDLYPAFKTSANVKRSFYTTKLKFTLKYYVWQSLSYNSYRRCDNKNVGQVTQNSIKILIAGVKAKTSPNQEMKRPPQRFTY